MTDRSSRFMASEIIRYEKLMRFALARSCLLGDGGDRALTSGGKKMASTIHGLILVERDGQKKMVIGNKGRRSRP